MVYKFKGEGIPRRVAIYVDSCTNDKLKILSKYRNMSLSAFTRLLIKRALIEYENNKELDK